MAAARGRAMEGAALMLVMVACMALLVSGKSGSGFSGDFSKAVAREEGFNRQSTLRRSLIGAQEVKVDALKGAATAEEKEGRQCISDFPNLCLFVDPLPLSEKIDGSTGETITLGAYIVWEKFHRDLPPTKNYGYGTSEESATTPGPTIEAKRHIPTNIQWKNYLTDERYYVPAILPESEEVQPKRGGIPIVMHLHGGENEPTSDGHPDAWFTWKGEVGPTFNKTLYTYLNTQPAASLWYHDHTKGLTRLSIYMGLLGMYLLHDPTDQESAFDLPAGKYDLPLILTNQILNHEGLRYVSDYASVHPVDYEEYVVINSKAYPYLNVDRTKYRFRLLNGCNLLQVDFRFLYVETPNRSITTNSSFVPDGTFLTFHQISSDGGYLETPVASQHVLIQPGERMDFIVDFEKLKAGSVVYLVRDNHGAFSMLMSFNVGETILETSPIPAILNNISLPEPHVHVKERLLKIIPFVMERTGDEDSPQGQPIIVPEEIMTTVSGLKYQDNATEIVSVGDMEIWNIINYTPSEHSIHLHVVKFRILSRQQFDVKLSTAGGCGFKVGSTPCFNGTQKEPELNEHGWKDTALANGFSVLRILVRFLPQDGNPFPFDVTAKPGYVWHCHMHNHEDYAMMRPLIFKQHRDGELATSPQPLTTTT